MQEQDFKKFISAVEGLSSEEDCFFLYSLARDLTVAGDILDIGSFKGRVSIALAQGLKDSGRNGRVYALESGFFGSKNELLQNIARMHMEEIIFPVFKHSALANRGWRKKLKLIWVDTDGNYFSGKCDFFLWEPYLEQGGVFAFSCADSSQIQRFTRDCISASGRFDGAHRLGNMMYACKNKEGRTHPGLKVMRISTLYLLYYNMKKIFYDLRRMVSPASTGRENRFKKLVRSFFERFLQ